MMGVETLDLSWKSPGPVSTAFMRSRNMIDILNGPIGSGKTRTNFTRAVRMASEQKPSSRDGVRKFRLTTVHANYRQLWRSTIESWWKFIPKDICEWAGALNGPASARIRFRLPDDTEVDFQNDFIAIGDNAVEDVMRGYETTFWFLNELDLLSPEVLTFARGRAGRYPDMDEGGPSHYGVLADCNAPELNSWLYTDIFLKRPEEIGLYIQPGGLDPDAENRENLPPAYYENQVRGQPEWYVQRMVHNRPGYSRVGKPVFPEFKDRQHVSAGDLAPVPGIPLGIGMDAGGSPAAVIGQRLANGGWRILDELVAEAGTGPRRFGEMLARLLSDRYAGFRLIRGWADPAAAYGADKKNGERDWIEIVADAAAIRIDPAPTNALIPRLEAIRRPLTLLIDGTPAFCLSHRCPVLREGLNSGYQYRKMNVPGSARYSVEPDKNAFSHPMDALGYLLSGGGEDLEIRGRHEDMRKPPPGPQIIHDWDPFAA